MSKLFITTLITLLTTISCFSVRDSERTQSVPLNHYYVQLKIINLADTAIDFYYNSLNHVDKYLNIGQEKITYKTPITNDYPGFIAIDRGTNNLEIYTKTYINEVKIEFFYIIVVHNDKIDFYEVYDINENYLNLNKNQNRNLSWQKIELGKNNITIEIQNLTGESIVITSNGYLFGDNNQTMIIGEGTKQDVIINLGNKAKCLYAINNEIFSLKYIYFRILYPRIYIRLVRQPGWLPHKSCIFGSKAPKNAVF